MLERVNPASRDDNHMKSTEYGNEKKLTIYLCYMTITFYRDIVTSHCDFACNWVHPNSTLLLQIILCYQNKIEPIVNLTFT